MNNFTLLSNKSFAAQVAGMIKTGPQQVWQFYNLLFNAVTRTVETSDTSHVNKMVAASLAVGRFNSFSRVMPGIVFFAFDKSARVFHGKIQTGKRAKLTAIGETGQAVWVELLKQYIEQEQALSEKAAPKDWSMEDAILSLVKKAEAKGYKVTEIVRAVEVADKKLKAA